MRRTVFAAMILATFMVSVEATIVATAIPTIVADLGGLRYFSWVFGAHVLTQAVTIPIYGRLADFYGRKPLLIVAIVIFLAGSVLSGFAHNMIELIAFRALQGIGGGGVQPVAITIVGDLFAGRDRARAQGFLATTWAFAAVIGPLLGAFLLEHVGWPAIFWINVPVGIACIAVVARALHERIERVAHTIDYLGSVLLAIGIGTLMYVLVMLDTIALSIALPLAVAALVIIAVLIVHEKRTAEPMLPLFLYHIRVIAIANAGNFCIGAMLMGISAFLPSFVEGALGGSAIVAGTVLGSIFVAWTCGSIGGARLQLRTSYRTTAVAGAVPIVIGALLLVLLDARSPIGQALAGVACLGLGFGLCNSVFVISTQGAVGWEQRGAATSSNIFLRQIGQAVGSAGFAAIFNAGIYARIPEAGRVVAVLTDPVKRALLAPAVLARDAGAVAASLHDVWIILAGIAVLQAAVVCTLPPGLRPAHAQPAPEAHGARG